MNPNPDPTPHSATPEDELIMRWIDGELSDAEQSAFEQRLADDPGFAAVVEAASGEVSGVGNLLRSKFEPNIEPPSPELFNARIMNHLAEDDSMPAPAAETQTEPANVVRPAVGIWNRVPWFIAAAAVVIAAFVAFQAPKNGSRGGLAPLAGSEVFNTYSPDSEVEIRTRFVPEAQATVLSLVGLEEIPGDYEVEGELVASYLPVAPGEAPVMASVDTGEPVFVLLPNERSGPSVVRVGN